MCRAQTCLLRLVALDLQALVDVDLTVPQQPHHTADQLHEGVRLVQDLLLGQVSGRGDGQRVSAEFNSNMLNCVSTSQLWLCPSADLHSCTIWGCAILWRCLLSEHPYSLRSPLKESHKAGVPDPRVVLRGVFGTCHRHRCPSLHSAQSVACSLVELCNASISTHTNKHDSIQSMLQKRFGDC